MARLAQYTLVVWVAVSLNFALPRMMPGDPLALLAGTEVGALTSGQRAAILADAGLDQPLGVQYARYLRSLAHGDLGYSYQRHTAVTRVIAERLAWTLLLTGFGQLLALVIGLGLGALAAWHHGRRLDDGLLAGVMVLDALPGFWVGMLLLAVFAVQIPLFPTFGAVSPWQPSHGVAWLLDVGRHLALPLLTLVVASLSSPFLVARASMVALLHEPFIRAARARGIREAHILLRHVGRNAALPVATVVAMNVAGAFGGATLVEAVFSYPGIGRLVYESVLSRDYPVLQAAFLLTTVLVIVANVMVDACYPWLDPRLRRSLEAAG